MPRRIGIPYRIIQPITVPIERLRIARRATLAPGLGRHRIARRDRQRACGGHHAIRATKPANPRIVRARMVEQEAGVVQLLPGDAAPGCVDVVRQACAPGVEGLCAQRFAGCGG